MKFLRINVTQMIHNKINNAKAGNPPDESKLGYFNI